MGRTPALHPLPVLGPALVFAVVACGGSRPASVQAPAAVERSCPGPEEAGAVIDWGVDWHALPAIPPGTPAGIGPYVIVVRDVHYAGTYADPSTGATVRSGCPWLVATWEVRRVSEGQALLNPVFLSVADPDAGLTVGLLLEDGAVLFGDINLGGSCAAPQEVGAQADCAVGFHLRPEWRPVALVVLQEKRGTTLLVPFLAVSRWTPVAIVGPVPAPMQ
ncbi:MAG: hypothetical protein RML46_13065 [Anaerolineae bacterium]|nr:hypothetical protein [Anaerolineae bacterium]